MTQQELNVQLISLALMEHRVLVICRNRLNEIEAEVNLKKSLSSAVEPSDQVAENDPQLKKSLSSSK